MKFGIKTYELCDIKTRFLRSFLVYVGKDAKLDSTLITADSNKTTAIVLKQGWRVWMDNFYNSSGIAKTPKTVHKTGCVSILKLKMKLKKCKALKKTQNSSPASRGPQKFFIAKRVPWQ
jgi:hypothetical protein